MVRSAPVLALLGLLTHFILRRGEWDTCFHKTLGIWLISFGGIATTEYLRDGQNRSIANAVKVTTVAASIYFGTLITSILIYRGFFHRLRRVCEL